jgi:hypothetical protein
MLELGANQAQMSVLKGNGGQWATLASASPNAIQVDTTPTVHAIAELDSDPTSFRNGHVAVVESVNNSDGTITVTESSSGLITTGNWMFLWRHRTVAPGWFSHFIHISFAGGSGIDPTVTSISPTTMTADGANGHILTINGSNFQTGDIVQFEWSVPPNNGTWNTGNAPAIVSAGQMTVSMNPGTSTDTIYVRVCNSAGTCSSGTQYVAVTAPVLVPTVSSVSPSPVPALNSNQQLTINGSNFVSGATVTYYDPNNNPYKAKAASVVNSGQIVDTAFDDTAETGTWKVTVTNPGGSPSTAFSFTVAAVTPAVSSVSPTSMTANGVSQTLTINGSNFQSGDIVQFKWTQGSGAGVWTTSNSTPAIVSASQITVSMNPGTVTDTISVRVCNSAGTCSSGTQSVAVIK